MIVPPPPAIITGSMPPGSSDRARDVDRKNMVPHPRAEDRECWRSGRRPTRHSPERRSGPSIARRGRPPPVSRRGWVMSQVIDTASPPSLAIAAATTSAARTVDASHPRTSFGIASGDRRTDTARGADDDRDHALERERFGAHGRTAVYQSRISAPFMCTTPSRLVDVGIGLLKIAGSGEAGP